MHGKKLLRLLSLSTLPLTAEALFPVAPGSEGTLTQAVRRGSLRVLAPSSRGDSSPDQQAKPTEPAKINRGLSSATTIQAFRHRILS